VSIYEGHPACDRCGGAHTCAGCDDAMRGAAREGKRAFLVRVIDERRLRVWADDREKAEEEAFWALSSARVGPAVDDLGHSGRHYEVEECE
jgi:hypothetical protein